MQVSHKPSAVSVSFDEPNLVSSAGLLPVMTLARDAGLHGLADEWLSVPTDKGANAGLKVASLVAGMVAGADSIEDMALLRHGGMKRLFSGCYAPSTLGSFLRSFTFGHVRQLDAVASRFLANLGTRAPLLGAPAASDFVFVDVDDTIIEVHGYSKQGSGYGYSGVRGLNVLLAIASTKDSAPVITAQRLRKGAANSARGANRLITDALSTLKRVHVGGRLLCRFDSAFYGHAAVSAALAGGAEVSVTVRMDPAVKRAIAGIPDTAWETIEYTDAVFDEAASTWVSKAEVAETVFTAFSSRKRDEQITGRLVVRRIPELNRKTADGQETLFDTHRHHAFFTTVAAAVLDTVEADKTHRKHAIIEQVNADLKDSSLAHLPSGVFAANSAWLVAAVMAYNLTRAAGLLAAGPFGKARTGTIRRKLIHVPARIATSARRIRLHLPEAWPWKAPWQALSDHLYPPPRPA
ncbi:IS1380 family transposase [Pseudarthrobacter sp. MDT3-26]|uniref:IS1380 family transposase n=1 Tax=Pseudarthrobacter raffinosi TaxID=2953651 RepID=UPI00208EC03D|nr:IS1380 family transposase [Pseudarthrobacter sp. MDT3-26]MCO4265149.1 IS1380 family transposase [Pseudarthrobacter sp. MDT3-26]